MNTKANPTIQLGDLVTAAFDAAAKLGGDAHLVSRRATRAIRHLLRSARIQPSTLRPAYARG